MLCLYDHPPPPSCCFCSWWWWCRELLSSGLTKITMHGNFKSCRAELSPPLRCVDVDDIFVVTFFWEARRAAGALFETDILIVRKLFAKHMTTDHHFNPPYHNSQKDIKGRYSSPRRPMTTMSGVLESSRQALSIRRIYSHIGVLFTNRISQKGG